MYISQVFSAKRKIVYSIVSIAFLLFLLQGVFSEENDTKQYIKERIAQVGELPFFALSLFSFAFFLFPLFLAVTLLHKQSITQFTTSRRKIDFRRISFSFLVYGGIITAFFFLEYFINPSDFAWNFQPHRFFVLCLLALSLFPVQIGFEEYFFRGYFMQWLGFLSRNRWVPLFLSSILFGLAHSANPEVAEMGWGIMVFYIGMGFLLGIVTLMDDGLELALGIHFANNFFACILSSSEWSSLQTPALFKEISAPSFSFFYILIEMSLYLLTILILAKKYKWTNWKEKLFGRISVPQSEAN